MYSIQEPVVSGQQQISINMTKTTKDRIVAFPKFAAGSTGGYTTSSEKRWLLRMFMSEAETQPEGQSSKTLNPHHS